MPPETPRIDPRGHPDLAAQIEQLAQLFAGWRPPWAPEWVEASAAALRGRTLAESVAAPKGGPMVAYFGQRLDDDLAERVAGARPVGSTVLVQGPPDPTWRPDLGWALIQVAARLAAHVGTRVNEAADKHFLAFLSMIGTRLLPPQPARVPITFVAAAGATEDVLVPAGTPVASPPGPDGAEVVFESERDALAPRARLAIVALRDPAQGSFADYSAALAGGVAAEPVAIFNPGATEPLAHWLYLPCDPYLQEAGDSLRFEFFSPSPASMFHLLARWEYWDGERWVLVDKLSGDHESTSAYFALPKPPIIPCEVGGHTAVWIRTGPNRPLPNRGPGHTLALNYAYQGGRKLLWEQVFAPVGSDVGPPAASTELCFLGEVTPGELIMIGPLIFTPGTFASDLSITWEYKDRSGAWKSLGSSTIAGPLAPTGPHAFVDTTGAFTRQGIIQFQAPADWTPVVGTPYEYVGFWIRLTRTGRYGLSTGTPPIVHIWGIPSVTKIECDSMGTSTYALPDHAFLNGMAVDTSQTFLPFGEQPRAGDTFAFCSAEHIRPGKTVVVSVFLFNPNKTGNPPTPDMAPPVPVAGDPELAWEVWNGKFWGPMTANADHNANAIRFLDNGEFTLALPDDLALYTLGGVTGYWVRASITKGDYGRPAYVEQTGDPSRPIYVLHPATFAPPVLSSLTVSVMESDKHTMGRVITRNDTTIVEHPLPSVDAPLTPFTPSADQDQALYLGFDAPLPPRPQALFALVEPEPFAAQLAAQPAQPARLVWEYGTAEGWRNLGARDETGSLGEQGLVSFLGPDDMAARYELGRPLYWLRARLTSGAFRAPPRLRALLTGTTWARQATTIRDEPLGVSDGSPNQRFQLSHAPILPGQRIEVFERELTAVERTALLAEGGPDAVLTTYDTAGRPAGSWVVWRYVDDFYASGPYDRHYVLDRISGELHFGDGRHGRIPPMGYGLVRAASYSSGGGAGGNLPTGGLAQLKTSLAFLDSATNYVAAAGGADAEDLAGLRARGPLILRHGGRAATLQDYEDLALQASPDLARVLALPPRSDLPQLPWLKVGKPIMGRFYEVKPEGAKRPVGAGSVTLVLVPRSDAPRPVPSLVLIDRVEAYMRERCPATARLSVVGPEWVEVTVAVEVVPTSLEIGDAVGRAVAAALRAYLHPLTGGDGGGWAFGRRPHRSDLYAMIESVPGVDHVRALQITETPNLDAEISEMSPDERTAFNERFLIYSGAHRVRVSAPGGM
ncbi:MAG: putative baseplate assembly protein [Chloroflexales bacterium]|nr:putative baseplate assembly protein [Chloroflexales bacterium]